MRVNRIVDGQVVPVYDIMEATYSGKDMGERSVTATIKFADTIDFQLGDFIEIPMQTLLKGNGLEGGVASERFYLYTLPTIKKTARKMSIGDAFETTVIFYPRQYELGTVLMRDILQQNANADTIIYTGFDNVTFYGGAAELMQRIQAVLDERFGKGVWKYVLSDSVNEVKNQTLERFTFSFSGNTVMEALLKIADKEGINSTFFINERTIYVGYKRPYFCSVNKQGAITTTPLNLTYGKTSHMPIDLDHGGLFTITKSMGKESPITRLYAYGSNRNLNRYYCSDRIRTGRYVNKLMLPSFDADGKTDYIESSEGVHRYGIREASKQFDEVYPSLRYMTYGDIREVKYCIKVKASGLRGDIRTDKDFLEKTNADEYPIARVQCYKVVEDANGLNHLEECAPDHDIAVSVHASGKVVRTVLYGGKTNDEAIAKQKAKDFKTPVREKLNDDGTVETDANGEVLYEDIPGACFLVHDPGFDRAGTQYRLPRSRWFDKPDWDNSNIDRTVNTTDPDHELTPEEIEHRNDVLDKNEIILHQIEYVDTFWLTDLYKIDVDKQYDGEYNQTYFPRDGYSAWCWARTNAASGMPDETSVNEVVAVEEIVREDTSLAISEGTIQQTFDVYLRDVGFTFDEQNDFGEMVFVFDDVKMSFLDGMLTGREYPFIVPNESNWNAICAYHEDGTINEDFFIGSNYTDGTIAHEAFKNGALWRVTCKRAEMDESGIGLILPMKDINAKAGDHVVFLDIYMPDIYIHAAENRLLHEAQKYLNANDKGKVTYSVDMDKVRILQIPNYPLQVREGLNMRMIDDDLNITTEDNLIDIYKNEKGLVARGQIEAESVEFELKNTGVQFTRESSEDVFVTLTVPVSKNDYGRMHLDYPIVLKSDTRTNHPTIISKTKVEGWDGETVKDVEFNVRLTSGVKVGDTSDVYLDLAPATYEKDEHFVKVMPLEFIADKYYTVVFDASTFKFTYPNYDGDVFSIDNLEHPIKLVDSNGNEYVPECEILSNEPNPDRGVGFRRVTVRFATPESFNDDAAYYIFIGFKSECYRTALVAYLTNVMQTNTSAGNATYVDFVADSVSIKIKDNTRPVEDRVVGVQTEPIYEVKVTLAENRNASSWASMNNSVANVVTDVDQIKKTYEAVVNLARANYSQLLGLKNSIFDPDGTCDKIFVQMMMMQVGADSMNYRLKYTHQSVTGVMGNYDVERGENDNPDVFRVFRDDQLDHYVYTLGPQGGTWKIKGGFEQQLTKVDNEWPVYYICIKCRKDEENDPLKGDGWICSPKQYAVNDESDTECWFFNWGILQPDSNGHYVLTETRGNSYMYGDKLICGTISNQAKTSWFDLDRGDFVLGQYDDASMPALSFLNGELRINGIGSENLYGYKDFEIENVQQKNMFIELDPGDYVFSADYGNYGANVYLYAGDTVLAKYTSKDRCTRFVTSFSISERSVIYLAKDSGASVVLENVMIQRGTTPTAYAGPMSYLSNAIANLDSEIKGGLMLSTYLMLKDSDGNIQSGMSGQSNEPGNGVAMWAGGTYDDALEQAQGIVGELGKILPILLTKTGIGSNIGCFKVESATEVSVNNYDKDGNVTSQIRIDSGDETHGPRITLIKDDEVKTVITTDDIVARTDVRQFYLTDMVPLYEQSGSGIVTKQQVTLFSENLGKPSSLFIKGGKLIVQVAVLWSGAGSLSDFNLQFAVNVGGRGIAFFNIHRDSLSGSSERRLYVQTFNMPASGKFDIESNTASITLTNIRCNGKYGGEYVDIASSIETFGFGDCKIELDPEDPSKGTVTDIETYHVDILGKNQDVTTLGGNGLSIMQSDGCSIEMLNHKESAHFRLFGLPGYATIDNSQPDNIGKVCEKQDVLRSFKTGFQALISNIKSSEAQNAKALMDTLPDYITALRVI